jgi:hypothetical protein
MEQIVLPDAARTPAWFGQNGHVTAERAADDVSKAVARSFVDLMATLTSAGADTDEAVELLRPLWATLLQDDCGPGRRSPLQADELICGVAYAAAFLAELVAASSKPRRPVAMVWEDLQALMMAPPHRRRDDGPLTAAVVRFRTERTGD